MTEGKSAVAWGWGEGQEGGVTNGAEKTFGGDIFIILTVVMVSQMYTYISIDEILIFKRVQFTLCQLYFN